MWMAASIRVKTLRGAYSRAALVCASMITLQTISASAAMPKAMCNLVASSRKGLERSGGCWVSIFSCQGSFWLQSA